MAKVYFVRHQAGGVMHEYPFAEPPTEAQQAAVAKRCSQLHGDKHPKTGEDYWTRIAEVKIHGADDVPAIPEQTGDTANVAGVGIMSVVGAMTVTPKAGE